MTAARHADDVIDLHFAAGADAEIAVDAGVEIDRHRHMAAVGRRLLLALGEAAGLDAHLVGPAPEFRIGIVRGGALGLIGDQQIEDHLARGLGAVVGGIDLHAGGGLADAARGQDALAFDLDHAGAAIAVGAVARLRRIAQMRDLDAFPLGDLPDGLARARDDLAAVEHEGDGGRTLARAFDALDRTGMRDARLAGMDVVAARRALLVVAVADGF